MSDGEPVRPERADRVNRVVEALTKGRRPRIGRGDAPERRELLMAAQLAGAREGSPHLRPAFRRRLALQLRGGAPRTMPTRREALVAGLALAAGAVAGVKIGQQELLGGGPRSARPSPPPRAEVTVLADSVIDPRPGRWIDVAAFDEMVEGQPLRVNVGAFSAFLVRQGDLVTGVSSVCSHLPCELIWSARQARLVCPCHNQSFDVRGEPVVESYSVPALTRVRVQVVSGRVQVLGV